MKTLKALLHQDSVVLHLCKRLHELYCITIVDNYKYDVILS